MQQVNDKKYSKKGENHRTTQIQIPDGATLIILIGAQGSGKTTFCKKHFAKDIYEVTSVDELFKEIYQELIDEEVSPEVSVDIAEDLAAAESLGKIKKRLKEKKIAVLDGGLLNFEGRMEVIEDIQRDCDHIIEITLIRSEKWLVEHLYQRMKDAGITKEEVQNEVAQDMHLLNMQLKRDLLPIGIEENYILQDQEIDFANVLVI